MHPNRLQRSTFNYAHRQETAEIKCTENVFQISHSSAQDPTRSSLSFVNPPNRAAHRCFGAGVTVSPVPSALVEGTQAPVAARGDRHSRV